MHPSSLSSDVEAKACHFTVEPSSRGTPAIPAQAQLRRGLKSRHIQFLALGGAYVSRHPPDSVSTCSQKALTSGATRAHHSIGTGLFVGSGRILELVGPAPLFLGYLTMMLLVWAVMNALGEMASYLPLAGVSVPYYVDRFVDPSLAFASGWNYWYAYAMLVAAEASAGAVVLEYWKTAVPTAAWIAVILGVTLALNLWAVRIFGEAEFWFASCKVITLLGLIILGLVIILGGGPNHDRIGFRYWSDPGAFRPYVLKGAAGNLLAYWTAVVRAGFAFITSPELIALAAGETEAPRRNIPKASRRFIWRLAVFYGFGSLLIGLIVPHDDPSLLGLSADAAASPWVIGIQRAGITGLNHAINAVILTSAWSAGNAFLYSGSRILYSLALQSQAPKFLARTNSGGVPWVCVLVTWSIGLLAMLNVTTGSSVVFEWFMSLSTISGYVAWAVCLVAFLRFRAAMAARGMLGRLPYRTCFQPYTSWVALSVLILLILTSGFQVFFPDKWSLEDFLTAYITIPFFLVMYIGHKLYHKTNLARKVGEIDIIGGVAQIELQEQNEVRTPPKNLAHRIWRWIA
jgi:yeast amino acid transporter